ncbi:MAG: carbon storage regulator CsrA [Baekduia sp.]
MLVLTRKANQSVMIGDDVEVTVLAVMGDKVRLGIQAPREIPVFRDEVYLEMSQASDLAGAKADVDDALGKLAES